MASTGALALRGRYARRSDCRGARRITEAGPAADRFPSPDMRRPVKVSEAVSASLFHARPPRNGAGRKKSTVTQSDIRGSAGAAA